MSHTSRNSQIEAPNTTTLTAAEYHDLMAAKRRRLAIDVLTDQTGPVDVEDLASEIAERTEELNADNPTEIERVATTLHHVHLPKMAALDVLEYDTVNTLAELQ